MTNTYSLPDYKECYFEYKELKRVHGKQTLDKIIKVWHQLKKRTNNSNNFGRGNHGYLALLLNANDYSNIQGNLSFTRPRLPGVFRPTYTRATPASGVRTKTGRRGGSEFGAILPPTSAEIII